jgi:hypothetical protein
MTATKKRDVVKFAPNVPVEVALKFALPGKIISTQNGERVMYTLADDRVMFLDLPVAKKVEDLGVNVREKFLICRPSDARKNDGWSVRLSPEAEKPRAETVAPIPAEPPATEEETALEKQLRESIELVRQGKLGELGNGSFAVPAGASVTAPAPVQADAKNGHQPSNNGNGTTSGKNGKNGNRTTHPDPETAWTQYLLGQTDALVDVYAAALSNASTKHGNHVKPEDVRSLLVTVFIQRSKVGTYGA